MKIRFIIIVFLLFPGFVKAQFFQIDKPPLPIDNLKKVLPLLIGTARVDCLNELARSLMEVTPKHTDSFLVLARQAYKEASLINYFKGLGDACMRLGVINQWHFFKASESEKYYRHAISWYRQIGDHNGSGHGFRGLGMVLLGRNNNEALTAFEQSAIHFRRTGNKVMLAEITDLMGNTYSAKGDFEKGFEYIKKGLQEKKRINDNRGMVWSFYRLAYIYQSVGDHKTALEYFQKSFQQARHQLIPWNFYRSMGRIFLQLKNYDSSLYYFQKMLKIIPSDGPALTGIGRIYLSQKKYGAALNFFQNALATYRKTNNPGGMMEALVEIGKTHSEVQQYAAALQYARESLALAREKDAKAVMWNAYKLHWTVYEALQQTDSAYFYLRKFVILKDSLNDAGLKQEYLQKLALFKVETREEQQQARIDILSKDNKIKHQQIQQESLQKKILAGSLTALALLSFIIFRNIALNRKNEKHRRELAENELQIQKFESERTKAKWQQQTTELEMQALRAQMNPHFIFNSLNAINRFILKKQSSEATEYLTKFSRLIRLILSSSASKTVSLAEDLYALQLYMELESVRFEQKFTFKVHCHPDVDADFIQVPSMILQPFVENAIWHGLMHKESEGHLWINICQEESTLICTITDDGIGRKKAAELNSKSASLHKSMGMRITADRIALLKQPKHHSTSVQVIDLALPDGGSGGTEVVIKIPLMYD